MDNRENNRIDFNDLMIKYMDGSASEDEIKMLGDWMKKDLRNREQFVSLSKSWIVSGSEAGKKRYDTSTGWDDLNKQIASTNSLKIRWEKSIVILRRLKVAATWLLFFALGSAAMYLLVGIPEEQLSKQIIVSVPLGSRSDVILPDGSKVWLNAGTQLTYDQNYGEDTRSLILSGEAFFEVARDPSHPFIVNASELKIVALGTRFNVKAYPEEKYVLTTLEEGKIDVQVFKNSGVKTSLVAMPNENIIFHKTEEILEKTNTVNESVKVSPPEPGRKILPVAAPVITKIQNVNTELFTSWKEARWIIENEPLGTLAPMLERRYNVKIIFNDEQIKKYNFTGTIENETVEQMMTALQLSSPIDFEMDKDVILLKVNSRMRDRFRQILKTTD